MHCDTIKEVISDYIDDLIEPGLKSQIREHLEACLECSNLVQRVKTITTRLRQTPTVKTSPEFDKNLRVRIISGDKNNASFSPLRGIVYGLSGLTAAAAVYLITTTTIFSSEHDQISPANFQNNTTVQQNQIINQQPATNMQPVVDQKEILAEDSSNSHSAPLEKRDIQLVGEEHK